MLEDPLNAKSVFADPLSSAAATSASPAVARFGEPLTGAAAKVRAC